MGLGALAAGTALVLIATGVIGHGWDGAGPPAGEPAPVGSTGPVLDPAAAGRAFLAGYVDPDGRVVRRDQGGDTVSEGQAYAMLVSVGVGDPNTFGRVWDWTRNHLLRPDGTLSWRWADGAVADAESAADADLDAARALVLAGSAFGDPGLTTAGTQLGQAVLSTETAQTPFGLVLTAGSWARQAPYAYNPSYASPVAFALLQRASADERWNQLATGSRAVTAALLERDPLPPDWAQIGADGSLSPTSGAAGRGSDGVRYSYDAARLPIRYAESCVAEDVALAAKLADPLRRVGADGVASRGLDARPLGTDRSPVAAVGEAAAFVAADDRSRASAALGLAGQVEQQTPTYYGSAWNALGAMMLQQDVLGGCPRIS